MRWLLWVVGVLIVIPGVLALAGSLLPKGHRASRTATLRQPPGAVWEAITRFEEHPSWRTDIRRMERLPDQDGRPLWREVRRSGPLTYVVAESTPPSRLVTRIADPKLPFGGTWTYEITAAEAGCTITLTEDGEIHNPIFRLLARFVFGYHGTMETYLKALGKKFGEDVTPAPRGTS